MTTIKILNNTDIKLFETPPEFTGEDRQKYFYFPKWVKDTLDDIKTPSYKVGFVLMYVYFKVVNKIFMPKKFHLSDLEYVAGKLNLDIKTISMNEYHHSKIFYNHKQLVFEHLGFSSFDNKAQSYLFDETISLIKKQRKPKAIYLELIRLLHQHKTEVPSYNSISSIITKAINTYEEKLSSAIEHVLDNETKKTLDDLLETDNEKNIYRITLLKKFNQSNRPSKIKENIKDFKLLKKLFDKVIILKDNLELSFEEIRYYSYFVIKSQVFQIARKSDNKKYLYLIAFIIYQYYKLHDILIDILISSTQTMMNVVNRELKEQYFEQRKNKSQLLKNVIELWSTNELNIEDIDKIISSTNLSDNDKIKAIKELIDKIKTSQQSGKEQVNELKKMFEKADKNQDYYDVLEKKSRKLQNRVSEIIKNVDFSHETSDSQVIKALEYYKNQDGNVDKKAPTEILGTEESEALFDTNEKFRPSLYKFLLFDKVSKAIKSGKMNLKHSLKYLSFDEYLIPKGIWENNKKEILDKADLNDFTDFEKVIKELEKSLDDNYNKTNRRIIKGKNKYISFNSDNQYKLKTPKVVKDGQNTFLELFPELNYVSLSEVLSTVNNYSRFLDCFEHLNMKYNRKKPLDRVFYAGIMGYGCNIGTKKIAKVSKNINGNELENILNWYFSPENINNAIDKILASTNKLELTNIYKRSKDKNHTSSDGQKFDIEVDSLNSNYSYKYFGKGKGVSIYSFIDERHLLFHSTVISSSEREAAYVIDGLMHDEVVKSSIHSTDTHGYSEIIFGTTHLLGFSFAPRIKNFKEQKLYSFKNRKEYESKGFKLLPSGYIDVELLKDNWDDILRFIATIKLKEQTASQIFRRLSSYSKQHELYKALKAFGRIIKSIFLLKYVDSLKLRQAIEKQLNKIESANKFAKVVYFGNNQEIQQATKEEQEIAEGCKRLIENSIICWNYLYLSNKLAKIEDKKEKTALLKVIKNGSIILWQHINLHGEYDFSDDKLSDSVGLDLQLILRLKI